MGELGLNKIFGAVLAAALGIMGLQTISSMVFSEGGHHGHHGEKKPFCESVKDDNAYWTDVPCAGQSAAATVKTLTPVWQLLAGASAEDGAREFKNQCSSCHTIEQGGANLTGPNLYGLVGRDIASANFSGYSSALQGVEGDWTYEQLNIWLDNPKNVSRGVNMVLNVKKDPSRADLIAYLAQNTPNAPAFPEPPEVEGDVEPASAPEGAEEEAGTVVDGAESLEAITNEAGTNVQVEGVDVPLEEIVDPARITDDALEEVTEALPADIIETIESEGSDLLEQAEELVEDAELPEVPQ